MKKITLSILLLSASLLPACGRQSTPSMMNTSLPRVVKESAMTQVPVQNVSQGYLAKVSSDYTRYGEGPMQITLVYDPSSKTYGAKNAFEDLARFKTVLQKQGVRDVTGEALQANNMAPTLMVSYNAVKAEAPAGCKNMPGFDDGLTVGDIGDYRFGCSTDTMMAKQIYRPSDLRGNDASDPGDGRRSANNSEYYRDVTADEADSELNVYSRDDIEQ